MTAAEALVAATARLRAAGVPEPVRDARALLAHAARIEASQVTLIAQEALCEGIKDRFDRLISLRATRVPVSHLSGEREFYGRRFKISGAVLDPRPETETLIEAALAEPFASVLDLGVGSGCILVTLLAERPLAIGVGVDVSEAACLQTGANAVLHRVENRAQIFRSDWFDRIKGKFDLIVSNPPYIARDELDTLAPEVRTHEPVDALTDGGDGSGAYRKIASRAVAALKPAGRLIVEIGPTQAGTVCDLFREAGLHALKVVQDLDGRDRVVSATAP